MPIFGQKKRFFTMINISPRVIRLVEFSPTGRVFSLSSFCKLSKEDAQSFELLLFLGKSNALTKNAIFWEVFWQTHQVTLKPTKLQKPTLLRNWQSSFWCLVTERLRKLRSGFANSGTDFSFKNASIVNVHIATGSLHSAFRKQKLLLFYLLWKPL
jgi:hypothetical protein